MKLCQQGLWDSLCKVIMETLFSFAKNVSLYGEREEIRLAP